MKVLVFSVNDHRKGVGLFSMEERARAVDGTLQSSSENNKGQLYS